MKKITLAVIAVLVFGFANAQSSKFGIKGGLNFANQSFSGQGAPSASSVVGYNVGVFVEVKILDKLALQPELVYSSQGSEFSLRVPYNGNLYDTKNKFDIAYLNVPIMFKYYLVPKLNFEAGPQIGFLTSSKIVIQTLGQSVTQDAKNIFESIDFGFNIGAGFDFTEKLFANARYNIGLSNVAKSDGSGGTIKNNVISLSLGYKF
jgi:Outer membrane protein beta-barrel domain